MSDLTKTWDLSVAELIIYIVQFPIVGFILVRHGKYGLEGWGFLLVFCILRLISSGIGVAHKNSISTTGAIINSIGISGLLLAFAGVLHEVIRVYDCCESRLATVSAILFHIGVVTGIVLAAIGGSGLAEAESSSNDYTNDHHLQWAGYGVLLATVLLVTFFSFVALLRLLSQRSGRNAPGIRLLLCSLVAELFGIARVAYGLAAAVSNSPDLSPVTGTFTVKFVPIFLVQLIAALLLVAGGLSSMSMGREAKQEQRQSLRSSQI